MSLTIKVGNCTECGKPGTECRSFVVKQGTEWCCDYCHKNMSHKYQTILTLEN